MGKDFAEKSLVFCMCMTQNNTRIVLGRGTEGQRKRKWAGPCLPSLALLIEPVPVTAVGDQHLLGRTASSKGRNLGRRKGKKCFSFLPLGEAAALVIENKPQLKNRNKQAS